MFKNRKKELHTLEELYRGKKAKLIVLYGRRRVGKTSLVRELLQKHAGIYFLARQETDAENLKRFSAAISDFFHDPVVSASPFQNWDAVFLYLNGKLAQERFIIAMDEFPYLVKANKALPSILQDNWDNRFLQNNAFIILCGSSISMMERTLGYQSPLYGRRTEQMLVEPLRFTDACEFFTGIGMEKKIEYYALLGGTPAYLLEFDYQKSIEENIVQNVLQSTKFLFQDALFVLREELEEPRYYFTILRSIANGKTSLNEIVNETGLDRSLVSKYLAVLMDIHLVRRLISFGDKKKSRKGLYKIQDPFFKFWFRFVYENEEYIEQGKQEQLFKEKILPFFNRYVGEVFEDISFQFVSQHSLFKGFLFSTWWKKEDEIDIVGKSQDKTIFIEAKWRSLSLDEANHILEDLKKKVEKHSLSSGTPSAIGIIAKHIIKKESLRRRGFFAFDLSDFS
ncbi:MAG: ATP-binding protein [Nanoarchaeota archaeon]